MGVQKLFLQVYFVFLGVKNKTTKKIFWINNVKVIVNSLIVNELKM